MSTFYKDLKWSFSDLFCSPHDFMIFLGPPPSSPFVSEGLLPFFSSVFTSMGHGGKICFPKNCPKYSLVSEKYVFPKIALYSLVSEKTRKKVGQHFRK